MVAPDLKTERVVRVGEQERRCLDKDHLPTLHDAANLCGPDSVGFSLLAFATHLPFPGRGIELSRVLDVHIGSGSDDAEMREVDLPAVKHLELLLHLERLVRSPVLEVRSRHEQLLPRGRWEATVCKHAPNHGAQSPPHALVGHTEFLRRVGGGKLLNDTGLQAELPELLPSVLATLVGPPTNDTADKGDDRRANV